MSKRFVFGYGSLVNASTHDYDAVHPARLTGWRRVWRHVKGRSVAFLTVHPDTNTVIDGMIAEVPEESWDALDQRERSYLRERVSDIAHPLTGETDVSVYHAPEHLHCPHSSHHPILLSYLDVVVQGYYRAYGEDGVLSFFETTDGWDAPILNDRSAPRYPRHQGLTSFERELTDRSLAQLNARILYDI